MAKTIYEATVDEGFTVIEVVANTFYHSEDDIMVTCHGDDFMARGMPDRIAKFDVFLANHFQIKLLAKVGPELEKVGHYMKRRISRTPEGFEWLGDRRQVQRLLNVPGLKECKPADSPGTKTTGHSRYCSAQPY